VAGDAKPKVTRETLLTSLKSEGFLVSQTAILNQTVTIDRSTGSAFKDFFWGQDIVASANIKVSSGIDLTKLSEEDVIVSRDKIEMTIPDVETHSIELIGQIELQNRQGIFKKIFDHDDGYNVALEQLKDATRSAAESEVLRADAAESAREEIERLIRFVAGDKELQIN
jgi:hypothetical protein